MRNLVLGISILLFASCIHKYDNSKELRDAFNKRSNQKSDTVFAHPMGCTECSDLYIDKGELTIPSDITSLRTTKDIKVCGNFPTDLLDVTALDYESGLSYKLIGKVVKVYTNGGSDKIPLFYVESWEEL